MAYNLNAIKGINKKHKKTKTMKKKKWKKKGSRCISWIFQDPLLKLIMW